MAQQRRRKKKKTKPILEPEIIEKRETPEPPVEEGAPPWMATFADMVTLLLCFFVLLLSFANHDVNNFKVYMGSIREALGVQVEDRTAFSPAFAETRNQYRQAAQDDRHMRELGAQLKEFIHDESMQNQAFATLDQTGVMLSVNNPTMFEPGSARLRSGSAPVLDEVIELMASSDFNLIIQGHTDGASPEEGQGMDSWQLSAVRAAACLHYILDHSSISPRRLKAVGYAGSKPLVPSTTAENQALNRRVEFYYQAPGAEDW